MAFLACQGNTAFPALQTALGRVIPCFLQAVNVERERLVVMSVLEALNGVLRNCGAFVLQPPSRLAELCDVIKAVLQRKVRAPGRDKDGPSMGGMPK